MHKALRTRKLLIDTTGKLGDGWTPAFCSGGLTYQGGELSAWKGGYFGQDRIGGPAALWSDRWQEIIPERLNAFADSISDPIFMLNVEHYPDHRTGHLIDIIEGIRSRRPDVAIGIWSVIPSSLFSMLIDYAQYIDFKAGHPHYTRPASWWNHPTVGPARVAAFKAWQARNDQVAAKLVPHVDVLFPSIYPGKEPDRYSPAWALTRVVELQVEESIRISRGLPVLPVYYPFVSPTKSIASEELTAASVEGAADADGFVMWGDVNTPDEVIVAAGEIAKSRL